jgi:hypothetical protein
MRESLRLGIPENLRGDIWAFVSQSNRLAAQFSGAVYKKLKAQIDPAYDSRIDKDLHRTFPDHPMFDSPKKYGQNALRNILRAYAAYDPDVGYCQGMGFIAAMFLLHMRNEEIAFWSMVSVMYDKEWRYVYNDSTPKLIDMLSEFERHFIRILPELAGHLIDNNVPLALCFSHVFTTIFIYDIPIATATRIIDVFLYDGEHIIYKILLNMMKLKSEQILSHTTYGLLNYLRHGMVQQ